MSFLVFVSCGVPGSSDAPDAPPLDDAALRACALFTPIAADVREGRLTGPPLFRVLQDVFNQARLSNTEGFSAQVQTLHSSAINEDEQAVSREVDALQSRCAED